MSEMAKGNVKRSWAYITRQAVSELVGQEFDTEDTLEVVEFGYHSRIRWTPPGQPADWTVWLIPVGHAWDGLIETDTEQITIGSGVAATVQTTSGDIFVVASMLKAAVGVLGMTRGLDQ